MAIYVIWGSTYLAIRFAVESMPPFAMAGGRFVIAGVLLYGFGRARGLAGLGSRDRRTAWISGTLMLLGGNGAVVWAEQWVPSGSAALLVAVVPLWMVVLDWLLGIERPGRRIILGLVIGFAGAAVLLGAPEMSGRHAFLGGVAILFGTVSWAVGSLYVRTWSRDVNGTMAAASQMAAGGASLLLVSLLSGEMSRLDLGQITVRSWLSFVYLISMGSIVAYTAYLWLMRVTTAARVSTYAYVNPVVAVVLGAGFAGEEITPGGAVAGLGIVFAVGLIFTGSTRPGPRAVSRLEASEVTRPQGDSP